MLKINCTWSLTHTEINFHPDGSLNVSSQSIRQLLTYFSKRDTLIQEDSKSKSDVENMKHLIFLITLQYFRKSDCIWLSQSWIVIVTFKQESDFIFAAEASFWWTRHQNVTQHFEKI